MLIFPTENLSFNLASFGLLRDLDFSLMIFLARIIPESAHAVSVFLVEFVIQKALRSYVRRYAGMTFPRQDNSAVNFSISVEPRHEKTDCVFFEQI